MLKLLPILLPVIYGFILYRFSVWRTHRQLDENSTELADPVLKRLTDQMAAALDLPRIRVHVYEIAPVNGLAAPDGRIFITRGFMDEYAQGRVSAEELASVIAHELGHVALGHARKRMIDFAGQNALRTVLTMMLSRILPGAGVYIARMLTRLVAAGLSRSDEYEADEYATALLMKSGIGTDPQKSLFGKLDALTKGRGGVMPAWLMSHPITVERIAAIEKNEVNWAK
ncbi:M48 family metallopeptidase [Aliiroseovarius sp. KMU-50]|uniref:M48 family metallopeptidase n=1 Tax=Aliiroseovarius salicola TaxID=3009082 RepID=A0ABT4W5D2_9RHOB|nr:M48 family metallopeptidase [Aliiroseovarius sp. KMU-50]MDA5095711.1 M48 family metallopeptidase [Aliiroseovarius sp. KMU-50]